MTTAESNTTDMSGRYSRKRLLSIAMVWMLAAVATFLVAPSFSAAADPFGCDSAPCQFPGQANVGGIVLASDFLEADDLITYGVYEPSPVTVEEQTPPGRVSDLEVGARLGVNNVEASNFTIYKSWSYYDRRVDDTVDVYIWSDADRTSLTGPTDDCGDDTSPLTGSTECDLVAGVSELATHHIYAADDCGGSGLACGIINRPVDSDNLWVARPENDDCPALPTGLAGDVCFGLVDDDPASGTAGLLGINAEVTTDFVQSSEYLHRTHNLRSVNGGNGNKEVNLENPYFEMRYGVGADRINRPTSSPNKPWDGDAEPPASPSPGWAQPIEQGSEPDAQFGDAALGAGFVCEGGGFQTFCSPPSETVRNFKGQGYDSIHREPSRRRGEAFFQGIDGGVKP